MDSNKPTTDRHLALIQLVKKTYSTRLVNMDLLLRIISAK